MKVFREGLGDSLIGSPLSWRFFHCDNKMRVVDFFNRFFFRVRLRFYKYSHNFYYIKKSLKIKPRVSARLKLLVDSAIEGATVKNESMSVVRKELLTNLRS